MKSKENTKEQLKEELRKTREELTIQKWGLEKTLKGMKALVKEIIQKKKELEEAKAKDEALAKDLEKYKLAVDNVSDQIIITDAEATVLYINNACEKITGYSTEEAVGEKAGKLWGNLMERSFYENLWKTIKIDKKIFVGEIINQRKNNQKYTAIINISPILDEKGEVEFFVGIERDITKEKEIDNAKSDFISVASHQLRTPMTSIQWVIERFLKAEQPTQKGREYLDDIHMAVTNLSSLVDLLLNVSRIEAGKLGVAPKPLELVQFIEMYLKECAPLVAKKRLRLVFLKHPSTFNIITDHTTLRNIVHALVSNALEYTPNGGEIEIAITKKDGTFLLIIRDTGIGILKEERGHIFEKFFRGSNAKLIKTDGTGLGLYITAQAAKLLGGNIYVESEVNRGSTFSVELPIELKAVTEEQKMN